MKQSGFASIFFITIVAALVVAGVYYFGIQKDASYSSVFPITESTYTPTPSTLQPGEKFGITYTVPTGWKYYINAESKEVNLTEALPLPHEIVTDQKGCAFFVGEDYAIEGPSEFVKNTEITIDGKPFTKRSWSKVENGQPFFHYYMPKNVNPLFESMYSWVPTESSTQCEKNISIILSSLKFTELE
jgi:hypothetical protein